MVRGREVVFYGQYAAYVQKELACKARTVVRDPFLWWSVVEYPVIDECSGYFFCGNTLHWCRLRSLCEPVRDDEEVFVTTPRRDEFSQYIDTDRR